MNTANASFRFLGLGRARRVQHEQDPADMGTCFGLDWSLDHAESGPAPRPEPVPSTPWWQRLGTRRRAVG